MRLERCLKPGQLQRLLAGTLSEDEEHGFARHLDRCPPCRAALDQAGGRTPGEIGQVSSTPCIHDEVLAKAMTALKSDGRLGRHAGPDEKVLLALLMPPTGPGQLGRLGRFEVTEVLGRGGFGIVLKGFDPPRNRFVAIKVLAPCLAANAAARRRFAREASAAAAVRHEHVVSIHGVDECNGLPFLVMEYVAGVSLQDRLDRGGPLALVDVLRIGMETARGLAAAHEQGLVHRDVKPANILLENGSQRVKLTDFGLARTVDDASLTQSGALAGTPAYMAPEQARGEPVDHRADLFSLGSVLYALCTGQPPFGAGNTLLILQRVSEETAPPVREVNPDVPPWLAGVIARLHTPAPAERLSSAAQLADLLSRYLTHLGQPDCMPAPELPALRPARGRRGWLGSLLFLSGAGLLALAWRLGPGEPSTNLQPEKKPLTNPSPRSFDGALSQPQPNPRHRKSAVRERQPAERPLCPPAR